MPSFRTLAALLSIAGFFPNSAHAQATSDGAIRVPGLREMVQLDPADYPAEARADRLEGTVRLKLTVDADGRVTEAEVVDPAGHGFDEVARAEVKKFRFTPATRDGQPIVARILYEYRFSLPPDPPSPPQAVAAPPTPPAPPPKMQEIAVRGEASATRLRHSAEAVSVIDTKRAHQESADFGEVMARQQGVVVRREGGLGSTARFSLNGFQGEQVRFFIDGVPAGYTGLPPGIADVPIAFVERVEVYRGVVPSRFGADALGGAVNLVTETRPGTRTAASYQVGSFGTYRATASGQYYDVASGLFARANGFYDRAKNDYPVDVGIGNLQGGTVAATVHRFHDGYRAYGAGLEAGVLDRSWAKRLSLRIYGMDTAKDLQSDFIMFTPYGEVRSAESALGATVRYQSPAMDVGSTKVLLSTTSGYNHRAIDFVDRAPWIYDWFGHRRPSDDIRRGETGRFLTDQVIGQHTVFERLGVDWILSPTTTVRAFAAPTWVSRSGEQKLPLAAGALDPLSGTRSLFTWINGLEAEVNLFDRRLQNIAFVKNYHIHASSEELVDRFVTHEFTDLSFGAGDAARYRMANGLFAKASYEHATRLPGPVELFGDGVLIAGNRELVPETSDNINAGFLVETGPTRAGTLRAEANGFLRYADNLITPIQNEIAYDFQNVYGARSVGIEGSAGYRSPRDYFSLDGSFTYQDFRNTSKEGAFYRTEGDRIPNVPWAYGSVTARIRLPDVLTPRDEISLGWTTRYVHGFYRFWESQGDKSTKPYLESQLLHSAALTYLVRTPSTFTASLEVYNLTDAHAYDNFGVQKPGRAFFFKGTFEHDWGNPP